MDKLSAGDDSVFVTLHWENSDTNKIDDLNDLKVVRWDSDSTKWIDHFQSGTTGSAGPIDSGTVTSNVRIQKFSPFTFGSGSGLTNPLPVTLVDFEAVANGDVVRVNWSTLHEFNNNYFVVERSADGKTFEEIERIEGAGNSYDRLDYSIIDHNPLLHYSYYRLKQVDYDGAFSYSKLEAVYFGDEEIADYVIFPNPTNSENVFLRLSDYEKK